MKLYLGAMRLLFFLCMMMICFSLQAQIVNVESQRMQSDTTGWLGSAGTNFMFQKNTVEVININVNAHVQYKTQKNLYLFLGSYNLLRGSGQTLSNNLFYHLRYNYKISNLLRWEVFTQLQQNSITGINIRVLAGTGPRFKLQGTKQLSLYAATAVMYEYEKEQTTPAIYHRDVRSSSYFTATYKPKDNIELIGSLFYQPLYKDFNDYRILNEISLKLKLGKRFNFVTGWYYLYDSKPAASTPNLNFSITNGIEYDF